MKPYTIFSVLEKSVYSSVTSAVWYREQPLSYPDLHRVGLLPGWNVSLSQGILQKCLQRILVPLSLLVRLPPSGEAGCGWPDYAFQIRG